jgi:hypothetical protein
MSSPLVVTLREVRLQFGTVVSLALGLIAVGFSTPVTAAELATSGKTARIIIHSYERGLSAIRAANPDVKLSFGRDPSVPEGSVLLVDYPAPTGNPAGRDIWCDAEQADWTRGRAISFQIKPEHTMRLSVSFQDRNRVAYTSWTELKGGVWQTVRIPFDQIRPNPYFQPPGANKGAPIDVSDVKAIGFAPQDQVAGRLAVGRFVVVD